jgi:hypothetical protein
MSNDIRCECGKTFSNKGSLYSHRYKSCPNKNANRDIFICQYCNNEYKHQYSLNRHILNCIENPSRTQRNESESNDEIHTVSGNHNISNIKQSTVNNTHTDNSTRITNNDNSVNNNDNNDNTNNDNNNNLDNNNGIMV